MEKCGKRCPCHRHSNLNSGNKFKKLKFVQQPKIKTHSSSLNYTFDEINSNRNSSLNFHNCKISDDFDVVSNVLLYDKIFKRNIYYTISKVDKLNNSMDDSESSEIDIFQKMNQGTQSLIRREMINKIFEEYNNDKLNKKGIFRESQKDKKIRNNFNIISNVN